MLLLALAPLLIIQRGRAVAAVGDTNGGGSYGTYAVVPGPPPSSAPVITSPADGQTFKNDGLINVSGSCPDRTLVKVYKNDVFAGSAVCAGSTFKLPIDLFAGPNRLMARAYNNLDAASPDSRLVNVTLSLPPAAMNAGRTAYPPKIGFYVTGDQSNRAVQTGQTLTWTISLNAGTPPFAVYVSWGDGKTDLFSVYQTRTLTLTHKYSTPGPGPRGSYPVTIRATDANGQVTFLQMTAIVTGEIPAASGGTSAAGTPGGLPVNLKLAWQLFIVAFLLWLGFLAGEKYKQMTIKRARSAAL